MKKAIIWKKIHRNYMTDNASTSIEWHKNNIMKIKKLYKTGTWSEIEYLHRGDETKEEYTKAKNKWINNENEK